MLRKRNIERILFAGLLASTLLIAAIVLAARGDSVVSVVMVALLVSLFFVNGDSMELRIIRALWRINTMRRRARRSSEHLRMRG